MDGIEPHEWRPVGKSCVVTSPESRSYTSWTLIGYQADQHVMRMVAMVADGHEDSVSNLLIVQHAPRMAALLVVAEAALDPDAEEDLLDAETRRTLFQQIRECLRAIGERV